ncbi:MAG: NAD(P)-dependent oxidoreductase [Chloroflexi bacterium OHK40]
MHIVITGASGGIGRAVVSLALAEGHSVTAIDRTPPPEPSPATFVALDMADYEGIERALRGADALIHLAAIPSPGRHPDHVVHNNNVVGSYNALRAAAEVGIRRVCQASSVNAIGHSYSRNPRYDYFPIDEAHPTYNEDPYSLSKWICEQQADSICRRYEDMAVASLRFHWVTPDPSLPAQYYTSDDLEARRARHLWAWTSLESAARACLLGVTASFSGHEPLFIIAPRTAVETPSYELAQRYYPAVPIRGDLSGTTAFFTSARAEQVLGWRHHP